MRVQNEALSRLLNYANDMRVEKGDKQLEDLPKSIATSASSCIIARAFNYGCQVSPSVTNGGEIFFNSKEDLETYLKVVPGSEVSECNEEIDLYVGRLTPELNRIALDFDNGEYEEYELKGSEIDDFYDGLLEGE